MTGPLPTRRADLLARLAEPAPYDLAVVGGGATGLGVALDAAARGLRVVLLESHDFAKGTSSRSTKLVHGGVRYLAQGHLPLVREALHERTTLLRNAPHLVHPLPFVMPCYRWWEKPFYGTGLALYDALAGRTAASVGLGGTAWLSPAEVQTRLPTVQAQGLTGGIQYWDGQFDDARLALALARTAAVQGALVLNYCAVTALHHTAGRVSGLACQDTETGQTYTVRSRCVVNATGVWVDGLRAQESAAKPMVSPSQGVHLVLDASFLPGQHAMLVPRTRDGRVLFALPWLGHTVLGTTDTPRPELQGDAIPREPQALAHEVEFILAEAGRFLTRPPQRSDVKSVWAGLRPLVKPDEAPQTGQVKQTRAISREHAVRTGPSGLVTVTGGKWTTYRAMAEDVLAHCMGQGLLPERPAGVTVDLPLVGATGASFAAPGQGGGLAAYGSEAGAVTALPGADRALGGGLTEAMVRFAVRHEYARTVEDVLARRARLLFLDAAQAARLAPAVADLLAAEIGPGLDAGAAASAFQGLAATYRLP